MSKFKPSRPLLARPMLARPLPPRARVILAPPATQRLVAPAVVKPILPPKPKLRSVLRPVAKPLIRAPGPTQRLVAPRLVKPVLPPAATRMGFRPVAPGRLRPLLPTSPVVRAGMRAVVPAAPPVRTERRAAKTLVRPVAPPVVRLRNVLRPVAKPLMTVPPTVKLSRVVANAAPPIMVATVPAISRPAVVPTILPPQPAVRMNLRTGMPIVDAGADPRRLIRYITPAAADFLTEYEDTVAGGTPHGFLRLVRSQYAGARARRGYGRHGDPDTDKRYKVTEDGKVWVFTYYGFGEDLNLLFDGSKQVAIKYTPTSAGGLKLTSGTVTSYDDREVAEADAANRVSSGQSYPEEVSASGTLMQTGYYKDTGGWAWYYNATSDYLEAIAAPKGLYSTQPKFTSSTANFAAMKANIAKSETDPVSRSAAIANATEANGVELPQSSRSSSGGGSVQTQAPAGKDKLPAGGGAGGGFSLDTLTSQVWFWPAAILVPTAGIIAGILLIPSKKPTTAPA